MANSQLLEPLERAKLLKRESETRLLRVKGRKKKMGDKTKIRMPTVIAKAWF